MTTKAVFYPVKNCTYDPRLYSGEPTGMFHCPECGQMVIASLLHPDHGVDAICTALGLFFRKWVERQKEGAR